MTTLIPRNTTIPTRKSEIFSTAEDSQTAVDIHVLQGERPMAADNSTLGIFRLEGIPAAPRGMPQIEVTFDIDANGILNVNATDKASGKSQQITITASTNLSEADVQRMVNEAETHAAEDTRRRELIEARNMADQTIYQTEKNLNNLNGQAPDALKQEVEGKIAELQEAVKGEDVGRIRQLMQEVQQAGMAVNQAAHQPTGDTTTASGNGTGRTDEGEDIVEGEFEAA
jgi:molecular chaperone DnaK